MFQEKFLTHKVRLYKSRLISQKHFLKKLWYKKSNFFKPFFHCLITIVAGPVTTIKGHMQYNVVKVYGVPLEVPIGKKLLSMYYLFTRLFFMAT